jgi:hypothetical protein
MLLWNVVLMIHTELNLVDVTRTGVWNDMLAWECFTACIYKGLILES